jgi:hypothetical protein
MSFAPALNVVMAWLDHAVIPSASQSGVTVTEWISGSSPAMTTTSEAMESAFKPPLP